MMCLLTFRKSWRRCGKNYKKSRRKLLEPLFRKFKREAHSSAQLSGFIEGVMHRGGLGASSTNPSPVSPGISPSPTPFLFFSINLKHKSIVAYLYSKPTHFMSNITQGLPHVTIQHFG
ncbi:hypothetical protein ILYODFUR_018210 [Ilyodon furcidens]|uniref:Uncharacterized protein n=1 Tax=Ilyodon furcidens TaxID=33524 RepID=A0ABV0U6N5_9TELE